MANYVDLHIDKDTGRKVGGNFGTSGGGSGGGGGNGTGFHAEPVTGQTTVTVNHNAGTEQVLVQAYENGTTLVIPDAVTVISDNSVQVVFSGPFTGSIHVLYFDVPSATGYAHTQASGSTVWNINHALNSSAAIVQIYTTAGSLIIPDSVVILDSNNIQVTFASPQTGTANIVFLA